MTEAAYPPGTGSLIRLSGEFVAKHREQLKQLARMAERSSQGTHGGIIVSLTDSDAEIRIVTSNAALAERIGERVSAVCGGSVQPDGMHENGFRPCLIWSR